MASIAARTFFDIRFGGPMSVGTGWSRTASARLAGMGGMLFSITPRSAPAPESQRTETSRFSVWRDSCWVTPGSPPPLVSPAFRRQRGDRSRQRPCVPAAALLRYHSWGGAHASLLGADCFGRHHRCRQHIGFIRLPDREGPSLCKLGARMCSTVGRWDKALQAMHAPASSDQRLPGRQLRWLRRPMQQLAAGVYAPIRLGISRFQSLHEGSHGHLSIAAADERGAPLVSRHTHNTRHGLSAFRSWLL
jgi:hypothetical protein